MLDPTANQVLILGPIASEWQAFQDIFKQAGLIVHFCRKITDGVDLLQGTPLSCLVLDCSASFAEALYKKLQNDKILIDISILLVSELKNAEKLTESVASTTHDFVFAETPLPLVLHKIRGIINHKIYLSSTKKLSRYEGIAQMIATYNHEFNNPLTIAMGNMAYLLEELQNAEHITRGQRVMQSLEKMSEIVISIRHLRDAFETKEYSETQSLIDIEKSI